MITIGQVKDKLLLEWSPEQISGYGKRHGLFEIGHERIYQYILADKNTGGTLYQHLRCGKKRYRKRYGSPKRTHSIKNRIFIDDRPTVVNQKSRVGDWEIDTIVGKGHQDAIVTIVERLSMKTVIGRVTTKRAQGLNENTNGLIRQYIPKGSSFADLTPERIKEIENLLNSRPRKSLNYATPDEVFYLQTA